MERKHCVYGLLLALRLVTAGLVRRQEGAEGLSLVNDVTFWKDQECSEVNGHMKWDGPNGKLPTLLHLPSICAAVPLRLTREAADWRLVPPGTAAVSLNAAQSGCQIFMCSPNSNCEAKGNAYGPIEAGACNIGAITVSLPRDPALPPQLKLVYRKRT